MSWRALADEIARWADAGRPVEFWWRDDDASRPSHALERLLALQAGAGVPLALAVIPLRAEAGLFDALESSVCVLQHGADHANRAGAGEKKSEFPESEPRAVALARLAEGRRRLQSLAGARCIPVLAPPWNRLARSLPAQLHDAGIIGVSQYGARAATHCAPGVIQVNTHVDIIDWRGTRGFAGEKACLAAALAHLAARRAGTAEPTEPTGWLTHHAVHDSEAWSFLARLFEFTRGMRALSWRAGQEIFHIN